MRSRVITVPKDERAAEALDFGVAKKGQLIELALSEEEFFFLDQHGIISLVNREGDSLIDDFEDASVTGVENLLKVMKMLSSKVKKVSKKRARCQLIQNLLTLFAEALGRNTGVYFFF